MSPSQKLFSGRAVRDTQGLLPGAGTRQRRRLGSERARHCWQSLASVCAVECRPQEAQGKHPVHLGRQGLCRRGWVTILTRASVAMGQAGVSAPCPPTLSHPDGAAVDLAPTHPTSQARNQLKAQRALPALGCLASLALTGSPVLHPMVIPRNLCFLCGESSCRVEMAPHPVHTAPKLMVAGSPHPHPEVDPQALVSLGRSSLGEEPLSAMSARGGCDGGVCLSGRD